jgi:integrase/recombinase XerC/integrase/recombinase XerD
VSRIRPAAGASVAAAVDAFLSTLDHPETAGTRRVYAGTLRALRTHLGPAAPLAVLEDAATAAGLVDWFTGRWADAAPATFNRHLDTLRAAIGYWREQEWLAGDPTRPLRRRGRAPDRTRALSREEITDLLGRDDTALREKTLWRMLYESAARAGEVLALDVEDLDQRNRCAKVRRKGNAVDVIVWQTGTARLLPRLLKGRATGPVFLTDRRARVVLAPSDVYEPTGQARLSYRRAAEVFTEATGGATLHQLRHSALTHAAEDGANTSTLLSFSGHTSVASLARYARVSPEALRRWQQQRDPISRRR